MAGSRGGSKGAEIPALLQKYHVIPGFNGHIQWSGIKASNSVPDSFAPGVYSASANLQWFGTLRGRLGLAVLDRGLIYGTGGLIYGHESVSANLTFPLISYPQSGSSTRAGWTLGGGFEYAFTQNLSGKLEGLYYDMGSQTIAYTAPVGGFTESTKFSYKGAIVRVGLNWKFM